MSKIVLITCICLYLITFPLNTSTKSLKITHTDISDETNIGKSVHNEDRNALVDKNKLWPNKTVYYKINKNHFNMYQIQVIEKSLEHLATLSCVKIKPVGNENKHHVVIKGDSQGCFAFVGYDISNQILNLGQGCVQHGVILHEFLHTIGFQHMQCTYDRDDYVRIIWENILPNYEYNFWKFTSSEVTNLGVLYDYGSIMHYPNTGFGISGKITIVALKPTNETMGQTIGLSERDIQRLNKLYDCPLN